MNKMVANASLSHGYLLANLSEMDALAGQIETDFAERAFAPFWDGVCSFAVKMGRVETDMRQIAQYYQRYKELHARYLRITRMGDAKPNPFNEEVLNPIDPIALKAITDWFRGVVRRGQRDFQFASIYEHYRTREVLVEGFRDLVKKFTDISHALDSVNRSLINGFCELNACIGDLQESIGDEFEYLRKCIEEEQRVTRQSIETSEFQKQERHEELLASYRSEQEANRETTAAGLERSEAGQQKRHDEILIEGKRDRRLISDIDRQVGGRAWWRYHEVFDHYAHHTMKSD